MSEEKKSREISDIQQEYQGLCTKAGHIQYQLFTLNKELEMLNSTLRDLNLEAAASKAASDKEAAESPKENS